MKIVRTTEHGQTDMWTANSKKPFIYDFGIEKEGSKVIETRATISNATEEGTNVLKRGEIVGTASTRPNGETSFYLYSDKGLSIEDGVELYKVFMQEANSAANSAE